MASQSEENITSKTIIMERVNVFLGLGYLFLIIFSFILCIIVAVMMFEPTRAGYDNYQNYTFFYENDVKLYGALPTLSNVLLAIVVVNVLIAFFSMVVESIRMVIVNGFISCVVLFIILAILSLALTVDSDAFLASLNIPVQAIEDPEIRAQVNFIQRTLGCCGSNDYRDYLSVQLPANMSHTIVSIPDESSGNMVDIMLPATCCVDPEQLFCTRMWSFGCKTALVETIVRNFNYLSKVGWGILVLDLLIIMFAVIMFYGFRKHKNEKYLNKQVNMVLDADEIHKEKQSNHVYYHQSSSGLA